MHRGCFPGWRSCLSEGDVTRLYWLSSLISQLSKTLVIFFYSTNYSKVMVMQSELEKRNNLWQRAQE